MIFDQLMTVSGIVMFFAFVALAVFVERREVPDAHDVRGGEERRP